MGFVHCRELISTIYPSASNDLNRIEINSKVILKKVKPSRKAEYEYLIDFLVELIPTYMLEGIASSRDDFLDKEGLDLFVSNLGKIHLIRTVPHELTNNVVEKQGMFMVSMHPETLYNMSSLDTTTLDFLTALGKYMIPYTDEDFLEFTLRTKWSLLEKGIGFNEKLVKDGLKFIRVSIAEENAMSIFLTIKNMKESPFLFSSAEFTSLLGKAFDFLDASESSNGQVMGLLSQSLFRKDFLDNLKKEIEKRPKEIIAMLSLLGRTYNAIYGDGSNCNEVLKYYTMLQTVLKDINSKRDNKPYEYQ